MDMSAADLAVRPTEPCFEQEAETLARKMEKLSVLELEKIMKLTPQLAQSTFEKFKTFNDPDTPRKPAAAAYDGSVFRALNAADFEAGDWEYAQSRLRIISTLYGLLRPADAIRAYRLNFHIRLSGMDGKNLYDYWKPRITPLIIEDARREGNTIVNLASKEIMSAVDTGSFPLDIKVLDAEFKEKQPDGSFKTVRAYTKPAHGAFARYILLDRIETVEKLKNFQWNGYSYNPAESTGSYFVYTR